MRVSDWSSDVCSSDLGCEIHCRCKDDQEYTEPEAILRRVVRMEGNGVLGSLHIDTGRIVRSWDMQSPDMQADNTRDNERPQIVQREETVQRAIAGCEPTKQPGLDRLTHRIGRAPCRDKVGKSV